MKKYLFIVPLLLFANTSLLAVTIVQCTDAKGRAYFSNSCPEGMTKVGEKKLPGKKKNKGPDLEKISQEHPVTLFAIPACDACDLVRNHLNKRRIPFTELNASDDVKIQARLKELAGSLTVPVLSLDDDVIKGYSQPALDAALDKAGYPQAKDGNKSPQATAGHNAAKLPGVSPKSTPAP